MCLIANCEKLSIYLWILFYDILSLVKCFDGWCVYDVMYACHDNEGREGIPSLLYE